MWTISKARNRKGFTLIELMIVIAIIIILAAIAIPSYLHFVDRAKKAKAAANMGNIAQYLATFNTDWSVFPHGSPLNEAINASSVIYAELTGEDSSPATINVTGKTTVTGENAPITYIDGAKLIQLGKNPWAPSTSCIYYETADGTHWMLYVKMGTSSSAKFLYRTDGSENLTTTSTDLTTATTP